MNKSKCKTRFVMLSVGFALLVILGPRSSDHSTDFALLAASYTPTEGIRLNQVGYLPNDAKVALLITNTDLSGQVFYLKSGAATPYTGAVGADRGSYAQYSHLYELDFSAFSTVGQYSLQVSSYASPSFRIDYGSNLYASILDSTMHYFRYQRCGSSIGAESGYGNCHLDDAIAEGGPLSGQRVDVAGGWHDAQNYPKLITTFGYAVMNMMVAYDRFQSTGTFDGMSYPVLTEVKIGLDWIYKMWDPAHNVLYSQVKDGTRVAVALDTQSGTGANIAGRAAASLALGSYLWESIDAATSDKWRTAAIQLYDYGKARQKSFISPQYYEETNDPTKGWKDDMALAAIELYRCTGNETYLSDALISWLPGTNSETNNIIPQGIRCISWWDMSTMANYEMARVYPDYSVTAAAFLKSVLSSYGNEAHFNTAISSGLWGTVEELSGQAVTALWYEDISGDTSSRAMANLQRDYILGRNPYGYSFVNGAGAYQVANMYSGATRTGWWGEGPVSVAILKAAGFSAPMGSFDTQAFWYKDDGSNYVVNEHTVTASSMGLHLMSWFSQGSTPSYTITASAEANGVISPPGGVSVAQGSDKTFTITANPGYLVNNVYIDSISQGAFTSYTFTNIQANHTITATFRTAPTYTITATAAANGSVSPSGSIVVIEGNSQTFSISANSGYAVDAVYVDGVNNGTIASYTFNNIQANHTISATFKQAVIKYTITASAGSYGSISPSGSVSVEQGSNQTFRFTPNSGYVVNYVYIDGVNQGAVNSFAFTNVQANHSINVTFKRFSGYTIVASANANGTISPSGNVYVSLNSRTTFTISPNPGYAINSVIVDGVDKGAISSYTFSSVRSNHSISASFKPASTNYTITASTGSYGSISPSGSVSVVQGGSQIFTINPNSGYAVNAVIVDGVSQGAITSYTFNNVQANHTISATFKTSSTTYTITASAGTGGTISPSGSVSVVQGGSQIFTINPNSGYAVNAVIVDGVSQGAITSYTFNNVQANHTISATFKTSSTTYTITASAGTGGTISPSGSVSVVQGGSQIFTINPNSGYAVNAVIVDGVSQGAITSYTFNNVQANHTISAAFKTSSTTYTITASAGTGGTISPSGSVSVVQGGSQIFTINPNSGYAVNAVIVDGVSQGAITSYTFANITANHTITATFSASSNIAPSGTGYIWSGMTSSTSNTGKAANTGINDQNVTTNVDVSSSDAINAWEAAGIIFSSSKTLASARFINGDVTSYYDGNFEANVKLQFTTDGTTWTDSGWTISPTYPNNQTASGKTYTFSGTSVSGKLGARIIGQVRVKDTSYYVRIKEVQLYGY